MKKRILVIFNPRSGKGLALEAETQLHALLACPSYSLDIRRTEGPTHATDLAYEAVEKNYFAVLVMGGDGTVNEVLGPLMYSKTALGVIPIGNGNGLARHLKMSLLPEKAAQQICKARLLPTDCCSANGKPFVNVAGVGLNALVAHDFSAMPDRSFWGYFTSVLRLWFKTQSKIYKVEVQEKKFKTKSIMVSFANGSQFGHNAMISLASNLHDGLMEVCFLKRFPTFKAPIVAWRLFTGQWKKSQYLKIISCSSISIKRKRKKIHLDGEPFKLDKALRIQVHAAALNILAPTQYHEAYGNEYSLDRSS